MSSGRGGLGRVGTSPLGMVTGGRRGVGWRVGFGWRIFWCWWVRGRGIWMGCRRSKLGWPSGGFFVEPMLGMRTGVTTGSGWDREPRRDSRRAWLCESRVGGMALRGYLGVGELRGSRMERDRIVRSEIMENSKTYICYITLPPVHMRCDSRRRRGLLLWYNTRGRSTTPSAHAPALLLRASLALLRACVAGN